MGKTVKLSVRINQEVLDNLSKINLDLPNSSLAYKINYFLAKGIESEIQNYDKFNSIAELMINRIDNDINEVLNKLNDQLDEIKFVKYALLSTKRYVIANNNELNITTDLILKKTSESIEKKLKEDVTKNIKKTPI